MDVGDVVLAILAEVRPLVWLIVLRIEQEFGGENSHARYVEHQG
jgi:hypothetical protein